MVGDNACGYHILIEDRIVGLKVRGVYENPAASALILAHKKLEYLVSTREMNEFKVIFLFYFLSPRAHREGRECLGGSLTIAKGIFEINKFLLCLGQCFSRCRSSFVFFDVVLLCLVSRRDWMNLKCNMYVYLGIYAQQLLRYTQIDKRCFSWISCVILVRESLFVS